MVVDDDFLYFCSFYYGDFSLENLIFNVNL